MAIKWIAKSQDGNTVTLHNIKNCKFTFPSYLNEAWCHENSNLIRNGMCVDVETTGLNANEDKIIELGLRQFKFNRLTGEILALGHSYSGFQDPKIPLSEDIKKLTGISDEMLKDQEINWHFVEKMFSESHIIIAHNASFDRPFIDKQLSISNEKIWACTLKQINWTDKGFPSQKLEFLGIYHGFFFENSHRALNDVDALLYLISLQDEENKLPYFNELLINAKRLTVHVKALYSPFESKELLKKRGYFWDSGNKCWCKYVYKDEFDSEVSWLEKDIYKGNFPGTIEEIQLKEHFKKIL